MHKKLKYILALFVVLSVLFFIEKWVDKRPFSPQNSSQSQTSSFNTFGNEFLPTSTTGSVVHHRYYSLSYADAFEQAEWVAYELRSEQLSNNDFDRPYFEMDPAVEEVSADWKNYKNSGYDRGHLCPAGDRRFSIEAFEETFLTSNISPQDHNFNSGVWNFLEQRVRQWAKKYDEVYVITGGVLRPGLKTIGYEKVAVPEAFYKIVLDESEGDYRAIAFLIPNKPTTISFYEFVVSIDEIESLTGIDFFAELPNDVEMELEANINDRSWKQY